MNLKNVKPINLEQKSVPKRRWPAWFNKIYWDFLFVIYSFFANIFDKTKKIYQYSIFLWKKDRDFDYIFLIELIDFKLERMKNCLQKSSFTEQDDSIKQIEHVQSLINDYLHKKFTKEERDEFDKKYKSIDRFEGVGDGNDGVYWFVDYYDRENDILHKDGTEENKKISEISSNIFDLERKRREECKNEIFFYMADNIENWWD